MRHPDTGALLDGHITEKQAKMGNRYGPALLLMLAIGAMDWIWGRRVGLDIVGWTPTIIALAGRLWRSVNLLYIAGLHSYISRRVCVAAVRRLRIHCL
jgi:hypothetical protein